MGSEANGSPAKRVLMIASFLAGRDGRWCYAEDLAARLAGCGFTVRKSSAISSKPFRLGDMVASALGARGGFSAGIVDVYSGQSFLWAEAAAKTLKLRGRPFVLALRGGNLPDFARRHARRVRAVLESAAAVVAPSHYLQEAFLGVRGDLGLLPNAVELELYPKAVRTAPAAKLMWLRSFHSMYNPEMAIRVLGLVRRSRPEAHLTMVGMDRGDGSRQACERLAEELGLREQVRFTGVVPKREVGRLLAEGDIFLNTTNVDNTPVSVIEAMACGLCVVSTNAGGVPYLVRNGEDGLLTDVKDVEAMAGQVLRLLEDGELSSRISRGAMEKASGFSWESVLPQWLGLLGRVAPELGGNGGC